MGIMKEQATGRAFFLQSENLVGRSPQCDPRFAGSHVHVSSIHALIRWTIDGWEARDLGSKNGTFVRGARLEPGRPRALVFGDAISFGSEGDVWLLVEEGPPRPMALQ